MYQGLPAPPSISIYNDVLEVSKRFSYIGSIVTNNLLLDGEID